MKLKKLLLLPFCLHMMVFAQEKPNILWITFEDTSPQFIGCYGNSYARTPVIDRLSAEGVRFINAFSTGTVCSPSRSAIITGVKTYKTGTGNHRSSYPLPEWIKGFPYYLKEQGYYTTNNSKTDYNIANAGEFIKQAWNESSGQAGWWNRSYGQPFFAVFNIGDSHQSRTMTESYPWYLEHVLDQLPENERIAENEFDMPPFYIDTPEMRKQLARVYNSIKLTDNKIGSLLNRLEKDHLKDSTIIFLFADHGEGIPRGKTNGISLGYRVPFIIWFPEMYKHLSPWGTGGIITNELISFEDLAPTLINLAGGSVPVYLTGRILAGRNRSGLRPYLTLSSDRSDNGIDLVRTVTNGKYLYSRNYLPFMPELRYIRYMEIGEIKQQMRKDLADDRLNPLQKSLFEPRPPEFLFDTENDPWETKNLVADPNCQDVLKEMRDQLRKEILQSHDVLFLPEYEIGMLSQTTTAFEFRLDTTGYPIEKIYKVASSAGFKGREVTIKQIEWLSSPDKIIRYWAIVGLRSQGREYLIPFLKTLIKAMDDVYPPVAVSASAIVFELSGNQIAEEKLKQYCKAENMDMALMAIHYLLYTTCKQPFIETIRSVHKMKSSNYNVKAACLDFLGSMGLVPNDPDYRE